MFGSLGISCIRLFGPICLFAVTAISPCKTAHAISVYDKVGLFNEMTFFTDSFSIGTAGVYHVVLTDFEFPIPLRELALNITTATDSIASQTGSGVFNFNADPGDYYASFYAIAGESNAPAYCGQPLNLGQYGIEISQVPVPQTFWLLGTGGIALWIVGRRKTSV